MYGPRENEDEKPIIKAMPNAMISHCTPRRPLCAFSSLLFYSSRLENERGSRHRYHDHIFYGCKGGLHIIAQSITQSYYDHSHTVSDTIYSPLPLHSFRLPPVSIHPSSQISPHCLHDPNTLRCIPHSCPQPLSSPSHPSFHSTITTHIDRPPSRMPSQQRLGSLQQIQSQPPSVSEKQRSSTHLINIIIILLQCPQTLRPLEPHPHQSGQDRIIAIRAFVLRFLAR